MTVREQLEQKYGATTPQKTVGSIREQLEQKYQSSIIKPPEQKEKLLDRIGYVGENIRKTGKGLSFAKELFIDPIGRALTRPFVEAKRGIEALVPGGKMGTELAKTPFGEITPRQFGTKAGLGQSAWETADLVLAGTPVEKLASKLISPLGKRARNIYQTVLKPSEKLEKSGVVKTGLEEGIIISKKGLGKVTGIMSDIGDDISKVIDSGVAKGKSINKQSLTPYLNEMKEYLSNVIGGKKMIGQVDNIAKEFLDELSDVIPIEKAQKIKRATQNFVSKYYNRQAPLPFETQKQLARGMKEEIAKAVPEISALNARDTKLFGLEEALTKALKRLGNRELFTLSDIASFGTGVVTGGGAKSGFGAAIIYKVLKNPAFGSARAILYNTLSKNAEKAAKIGKWTIYGAIGKVISDIED